MRSLLVFPFRKFGFHEESLSLAEKTRFASPQRRMAANVITNRTELHETLKKIA
jgi:hypothetical protein